MTSYGNFLQRLNEVLNDGHEAKLTPEGRIFYINHYTQTTAWLPPRENWDPASRLPYGWELAIDIARKPYYINHVEKYTTREDPREDPDYVEPPKPREVELVRDPSKGFGFVAGSEKPVIVRFVTEEGPSVDKLLPADQIIQINGEDVKKAPREYVIDLVRSCKHAINLTVCQPYVDNSSRKSAILTAAKKARLKSNPSRVRFADCISMNGASVHGPSVQESYVPLMPNVLKVFLENGQTKSFKYDNKTTVKDVLTSMQEKLNIQKIGHFALVLQNTKSTSHGKLSILQEQETLAEIASRPGAMHFRCLFRVTFVPKDAYDLLREDIIAFEYFYMQCCNDVVQERYAAELKCDTALRLAALQIQQHVMSNNITNKISIKIIERDCGLEKFVPVNLLESMKGKDVRKIIHQYLKMNQSLSAPGQKQLTALQAKLHYLKIISELKTFGSRIFMVTILDKKAEGMILVGPKSGVSLITNIKSYATAVLAEFEDIESITISKEGESMYRADVCLRDQDLEHVYLGLLREDLNNFLALTEGYHRIFTQGNKTLIVNIPVKQTAMETDTPPYEAQHKVVSSYWSYPEDLVSQVVSPPNGGLTENIAEDERIVDLAKDPPLFIDHATPSNNISNNLDSTTSDDGSLSTEETNDLDRTQSPPTCLSGEDSSSSSTSKLSYFEEGVTSFGRISTSSEMDIENLAQVYVNKSNIGRSESDTISENPQVLPDETHLKTFIRYVPSPIASLNKRRKSGNLAEKYSAEADDVLQVSVDNNECTVEDLGNRGLDLSSSDADTDSVFGADTEWKPLLSGNGHMVETEREGSWGQKPEGSLVEQVEESSQPVTACTSGRLHPRDLPHNFGVHSSDELPRSEEDFKKMATSFGLHSPDQIPPEMYNAVYDPRLFCDGGLYLDPDIIDLTLIPPPKTPDNELTIDFSDMANIPPPEFVDNGFETPAWSSTEDARTKLTREEIDHQFEELCKLDENGSLGLSDSAGQDYESDSGNETVSSENIELTNGLVEGLSEQSNITQSCHRIFDHIPKATQPFSDNSNLVSNLDDLIARLIVPPPPPTNTNTPADVYLSLTKQPNVALAQGGSLYHRFTVNCERKVEEEIESLIIPPPPASPPLMDIPIVPPVSMEHTFSSKRGRKKHHPAHKRSNSVDLSMLRKITDSVTKESSVAQGSFINRIDYTGRLYFSAETLTSQINVEVDSPSTVSEKLTSLLKSIPLENINLEQKSSNCLTKTWSNRERRGSRESSASINSQASSTSDSEISRSSSLRVRRSLSTQPIDNGHDTASVSDRVRSRSVSETTKNIFSKKSVEMFHNPFLKSNSVGRMVQSDPSKRTPDRKSDTFAALKSKLQEYRDIMLRRKYSSAQKCEESNTKGDKKSLKGQRKSSNLRRSRSLSESDPTIDSVSKQTLPRKQSLSLSHPPFEISKKSRPALNLSKDHSENPAVDENQSDQHQKKVQMKPLFNTLPVNFNKFSIRSLSTSDNRQESSGVEDLPIDKTVQGKKRGPLKALRSVFEAHRTQQKNSPFDGDEDSRSHKSASVSLAELAEGISYTADPDVSEKSGHEKLEAISGEGCGFTPSSDCEGDGSLYGNEMKRSAQLMMWRPISRKSSTSSDSNSDRSSHRRDSYNSECSLGHRRSASVGGAPLSGRTYWGSPPETEVTVSGPQLRSSHGHVPPRNGKGLCDSFGYSFVKPKSTNLIKFVMSREYIGEKCLSYVANDLDCLVMELEETMLSLSDSKIDKQPSQLIMCRDELVAVTLQFVSNVKCLVTSSIQSSAKLFSSVNSSVHTLAKMFLHCHATVLMMNDVLKAGALIREVSRLAQAYKKLVRCSYQVMYCPQIENVITQLKKHASWLATLLADLMKLLATV